jgi:hypothetical protein
MLHAGMSAWCQFPTHAPQQAALIRSLRQQVRADCRNILMPSALAVFILMTNRNFVSCMTGRSAGLGGRDGFGGHERGRTRADNGNRAHRWATRARTRQRET